MTLKEPLHILLRILYFRPSKRCVSFRVGLEFGVKDVDVLPYCDLWMQNPNTSLNLSYYVNHTNCLMDGVSFRVIYCRK